MKIRKTSWKPHLIWLPNTGVSFVDNLSDGSIWFVAAIHSVPADKHAECSQLISQFFTNGHNLRPRQNDEAVERLLSICGHINFLEADTDEDVFKFLWSLDGIKSAETMEQSGPTKLARENTPFAGSVKDDEVTDQDL